MRNQMMYLKIYTYKRVLWGSNYLRHIGFNAPVF